MVDTQKFCSVNETNSDGKYTYHGKDYLMGNCIELWIPYAVHNTNTTLYINYPSIK